MSHEHRCIVCNKLLYTCEDNCTIEEIEEGLCESCNEGDEESVAFGA